MLAPMVGDEELVGAAAAGDRRAFRALALRLTGPALGLATRVLGDRATAEDAVQEALLRLWREAPRFDPGRGSFPGWWRRMLMNCALDRRRTIRAVVPLDEAAAVADPGPTPETAAAQAARRSRIDAAMAALNPRQRAAIALFHGEGASMKEIAVALETTPKAVEGLLTRARAELARSLAELEDEA